MKCILILIGLIYSSVTLAELHLHTSEAVLADMAKMGEKSYLMSLYNQPEKWAYVLGQIETGAKPWLNIADLLKAHSDAATTKGLNYAMFFALKNAPSNVLTVLGKHYSVKEVCVSPFIEEELEYELGFLKTIRNRLIKTTTVSNEKASCLASIEQQISDFSKMPH